ncbi:MAG: hypothetical protein AUJ96_21260 [Armatimonadetes bacterium CG2_30_66_41]|nr:MerR family transcriptional regulator [Armatimonadota bacterium]OIO98375.1 MAG: hypothetical protein AUJ96_21260 [Armatimonadetes bacterium CG2_30_66_41]NCO94038.1 MerR family transcriptional regulator [Armatimonadota bacterium]NCP28765.1 MerR family transcriptional regulator [Armatimonadota bacterium]NCQ27100.1 MerR family transcriptional regulator [Armatimonadota bacterium]
MPADNSEPVYAIGVAAKLLGTHPQTLRMYERMGLLGPHRSDANRRLYSETDLEVVRRIQHLTQDMGVNLAGAEVVFRLLEQMDEIRADMRKQMEQQLQEVRGAVNRQMEEMEREMERMQALLSMVSLPSAPRRRPE